MSADPPAGDGTTPAPAYPSVPEGHPAYPGAASAPAWTPTGPAPGFVYAGFGARFLGYVIDTLLLIAVEAIVYVPLVLVPAAQFYQAHPAVSGQPLPALPSDLSNRVLVLGVVGALVSALYFGGLVAWYGRTVGQRVVGAYVVRAEDGGRVGAERAFLRAIIFWGPGVLGVVPVAGSIAGLVALVGLLAVLWDPRKQGWHDKLGRTLVLKRVQ
jgi:uncharacterized RDD family membrane protein YckC